MLKHLACVGLNQRNSRLCSRGSTCTAFRWDAFLKMAARKSVKLGFLCQDHFPLFLGFLGIEQESAHKCIYFKLQYTFKDINWQDTNIFSLVLSSLSFLRDTSQYFLIELSCLIKNSCLKINSLSNSFFTSSAEEFSLSRLNPHWSSQVFFCATKCFLEHVVWLQKFFTIAICFLRKYSLHFLVSILFFWHVYI